MSKDDPQSEARLIEHLVGSVLGSIVKAQGLAASQLVEMIELVGFEQRQSADEARKVRTFEFDFFRSEVDETTNQLVRQKVTASVPLLTLINLPSIAIDEAKIEMDLRLVAHEQTGTEEDAGKRPPLKLYAVPAKKQIVRSQERALAVDSAGTIKINVTMRQQEPLGLSKVQDLLEGGAEEVVDTSPPPVGGSQLEAPPALEPSTTVTSESTGLERSRWTEASEAIKAPAGKTAAKKTSAAKKTPAAEKTSAAKKTPAAEKTSAAKKTPAAEKTPAKSTRAKRQAPKS